MFKINKEEIELVWEFIFLGSKIVHDGTSAPEVKCRITLGHSAMVNMYKVWKSRDIEINIKSRLVRE